MELSEYANAINLFKPFNPTINHACDDHLQAAIEAVIDDPILSQYANQVPAKEEQRNWLKALLTMRQPGQFSTRLLSATDGLLQSELADKHITEAITLPRVVSSYPASAQVSVWNGDISTLRIGAIVNAANSEMLGCFQPFHACIDNVINCAAGPRLREDCHTIMQLQGHNEGTGEAKITRAYNLPSHFILHTVGPIVRRGNKPTRVQQEQLANCYTSCLALAAQSSVKSIAFCGISTGVFGYPAEDAAKIALESVANWLEQHPRSIEHVVFNTYGEQATKIYHNLLKNWNAL